MNSKQAAANPVQPTANNLTDLAMEGRKHVAWGASPRIRKSRQIQPRRGESRLCRKATFAPLGLDSVFSLHPRAGARGYMLSPLRGCRNPSSYFHFGVLVFLLAVIHCTPVQTQVCNLKVVTDASPDYSDLESMVHSMTSQWASDVEKCWAVFYWLHKARRQTSPIMIHGLALTDPVRQFNDYGHAMCSTISGINASIWNAMGYKVKYWDITGHTVPEVFYDGSWHMYDNSMSAIYTLCDGKTIAGVEDIGKKGGCETSGGKVEPGHIAKYHCLTATGKNGFLTGADCARDLAQQYRCFNPNSLKYRYYFNDWDRGHRYILNLRQGEVYTRYYRRLDVTTPGGVQQHKKYPKYLADQAYYIPNQGKDPEAANIRYRIRSNGRREWKPDLAPDKLSKSVVSELNVVPLDPKGVRPDRAGTTGEVVFKVEGGNVITSLNIRGSTSRKTNGDVIALSVSTTNGLAWKEVWLNEKTGRTPFDLKLIEEVNGAYEVLVKAKLTGKTDASNATLEDIRFNAVTMLNSKTQPRLNLGKNTVYVGAGEQTESIVFWPDLQGENYKPYVVDEKNIVTQAKHPGYMGVMHAAKAIEDAYVVFRINSPREITKITYGGRLYNRAHRGHIDFLHSFDEGKTWTKTYTLTNTKPPWDVIRYETVEGVPAGTKSVLFKYLLNASAAGTNACSIYAVRMEVNHKPASPGFKPFEVTFNWSEVQKDRTLVERSHSQLIEKLPTRYDINVGGEDHPVMNSLRTEGTPRVGTRYGYSDGKDAGGEKFVGRWVTYGKNLAEGKSYTISHPSIHNWGAGDPDGKKLTDGVTGPPYAGGNSYRFGACWNPRTNPVITLDLGEETTCATFGMNFHGYPWWDALKGEVKDKVEVLTSIDGKEYVSLGFLNTGLRWRDLPANHIWPDVEKITGHTFRFIPDEPVKTRYVQYKVTNVRIFDCTELEVLDAIQFAPFNLRIALPDEKPVQPRLIAQAAGGDVPPPPAGRTAVTLAGSKPLGDPVLEPPTLRSLGAYWMIRGDVNRNAKIAVSYREAGEEEWKKGYPLFRVEKNRHKDTKGRSALNLQNGAWLFAGSVVLLQPGTEYEIKLSLTDPDGGSAEKLLKARTRSEPVAPANAQEYHVVPGNGGGMGTKAVPYKGLVEAQKNAKPGSVLLLHAGVYEGTFLVTKSGQLGKPIIWRGAGDGEAVIDGQGKADKRPGRAVSANDAHDVWFEDLTMRNANFVFVGHNAYRIVIRRCHIHGCGYGITNTNNSNGAVRDWFISDNLIEGPSAWPRTKGIEGARGVQVTGTGHVVCHNRIRGFADAIDTFPSSRCSAIDFHNNDISEMTDDGIEMDYSFRNTRCFYNRLTNTFQGISTQPLYGGPVYIFNNAMYNVVGSVFKMHNSPSGGLMFHNTCVKKGPPVTCWGPKVSNFVYRNNLFIGTSGNYAFESTAKMVHCDFDYDGYGGGPWQKFMKWNGVRYPNLAAVKERGEVYKNGVKVEATPFGSPAPADEKTQFDASQLDLRLKKSSAAIDAGQLLPGFNDDFTGKAPDLGAYEFGKEVPHYGPRPAGMKIGQSAQAPAPAEGKAEGVSEEEPKRQGPPRLDVPVLSRAPKIDGVLDDPAWNEAGTGTGFRGENGEDPRGKVRLLTGQDARNLYVALECFGDEDALKSLVADSTDHDASDIWADDEMEVFIDPAGERKSYYQIIVNAGGVSWDAFHAAPGQPDTSWEPKYRHKARVGPRSWILELALPWSIFNRTAKANTEWAFNALIHRRRAAEWLYWSPVFNRTAHTPQKFGELVGMPAKRNVTGWRGDGAGHYLGAAPPLEWSKKKNIAWHAEVGHGFSSPVIVGSKVFITAEPNELICLDAVTGKILWKRTNGADDLPEELQNRDLEPPTECGYASPTPCSDGEHVYALFGSGVVACYDVEGKRKWIRLIEIEPKESNGRSASPVLAGDRLLVHVSDLFCLDAKTGKTVWTKEAEPGFGTLAVVKVGNASIALTAMGDVFRVIDGKKLAREIAILEVPSPVIKDGVAYFIGGKAKAVKVGATPSGVVVGSKTTAEDVTPTKTLWETDLDGEFYASPIVHDGLVHSVSKQGDYVILDAKTGKKLASKELEIDSEFAPSLSLAGGKLFVQSDSGVTLILEPGSDFKLIRKIDLGEGSVATPAFSGQHVFIRGVEKLWCVSKTAGVPPSGVVAGTQTTSEAASSNVGQPVPPVVSLPPSEIPQAENLGHNESFTGWRGNASGLYPDSSPPLKWGKVSRLMSGLRCSAAKPKGNAAEGSPAYWGAVTEWLILGPLPAEEGKGIEKEFFKEAECQPSIDEKVNGIAWRLHKSSANMIDLARVFGKDARGVAYAHSYLWSETEGNVLIRFNHYWRLKAWFNGEAVEPKNKVFRAALKKGWNRLLCKVDWAPQKGQYQVYPSLWHLGVSMKAIPPYETVTENIVWQTRLPDWSISSPLIVGEHIYVMSEPNDLVCLDKADGRILWVRSNHFFDTLSDEEKGSPAFAEIAAKAARLREINDSFKQRWPDKAALKERAGLQAGIRKLMAKADKEKYARNWQEMHGYSVPTPVSDGTDIYVWIAYGIGARYDRDGDRKWIHLETNMIKHHGYTSSPVLVDGKMIVYMKKIIALEMETGKVAWRVEGAKDDRLYGDHFHNTPLAIRVGEQNLLYTHGMVLRPSDGKTVWENSRWKEKASIPTPVVGGGYLFDITSAGVLHKARIPPTADQFALTDEGKFNIFGSISAYTRSFVAASPLYHDGLLYIIDCMGNLRVVDAQTQDLVYRKDLSLGFEARTRVHTMGTAYASPILAGDAIIALGMSGTMVAFKPGRGYVELSRNRIENVTNPGKYYEKPEGFPASPACDGNRLYIRGDEYLYCVGIESKDAFTGWRGNTTGLYPDATPVIEWGRASKGIAGHLKISASKPAGDAPGEARQVRDHYPKEWLVIGPFPAPKGLDTPALPGEANVQPTDGDKVGELAWTKFAVPDEVLPPADRSSVAGSTKLRFVEPEKVLGGFKADHLVYAHTWLHSQREGEVEAIIDHSVGLRIWLNGEDIYKEEKTQFRMNWYTVLSKFRTLRYGVVPSPRARLKLREGWNRVLLKLSPPRHNWGTYKFNVRIVDVPDAPYEEENILWSAPLPDRSNATPLLVGDRIFVMAEPEQILCLDKRTGEQLWTRFLGRYQTIPQDVRDASPAFKEKVEPLVAELAEAKGLKERLDLRKKIDAALVAIDKEKYALKWDGHMAGHFRIVGWTTPSPCSDGKYIYAYCGNGVAACFDLDGNTRWIRRANTGMLFYSSSPALIDDKFVLFAGGMNMVALDAATGEVAWTQPAVDKGVAALIPARINGVGVIISQKGDIVRASDGKVIFDNPQKRKGDSGWAPPLCLGNVVYQPWLGVGNLHVNDFSKATGDTWSCQGRAIGGLANPRNKDGKWVDRWTCGSPLVHEGIYYNQDVFGTLYAADLKTRKLLYRVDLSSDFNMMAHYNAVGVAASITLGGKQLFVSDNQGNTVVFEPGPVFKKVAVNRIERQIDRPWPIRPQEETGYSPPVFEGPRMYLRGEYNLYCIGKE